MNNMTFGQALFYVVLVSVIVPGVWFLIISYVKKQKQTHRLQAENKRKPSKKERWETLRKLVSGIVSDEGRKEMPLSSILRRVRQMGAKLTDEEFETIISELVKEGKIKTQEHRRHPSSVSKDPLTCVEIAD